MQGRGPRRVLLVCGDNTTRSPLAKAILEEKLKTLGRLNEFEVDSAAFSDVPISLEASGGSRIATAILCGHGLLR